MVSLAMSTPYWFKLLDEWVNTQENSGLSIPFLVGAEKVIFDDTKFDSDSIKKLFNSIITNAQQDYSVTLKYCNTISAYILGLEIRSSIKENFFEDENGTSVLVILNNTFAKNSSLVEIVEFLEGEYLEHILSGKYSRQNTAFGDWGAFSASDLKFITLSNHK